MSKRISDRYRAVVRVTRICADIVGADVFVPSFRFNVRTFLVLAVINLSFAFLGFTIYDGFAVKGDWKVLLQALSIGGGTLVQGYVKLVNALRQKSKIQFLNEELYSIYEEYELKHSDYRLCLNKSIRLLIALMKIIAFIAILLVLGMAMVTFILATFFDTRELIVLIFLPGVDAYTDKGFLWTNILQLSFVAVGGFGFYAADMNFVTPISQINLLKELLRCKFRDLNDILQGENKDKLDKAMIALKDIIEFHQRYVKFLNVCQDSYFWVILVQINTFGIGIVCTLFCLFLGSWPSGYIYMIYCFVMMYLYCGMGTLVEAAIDDVISACYNDICWYLLSTSQQKMLITMLMMAQNTKGLTVGGVTPLSVNTGLAVTKSIYSIAMMLISFAE